MSTLNKSVIFMYGNTHFVADRLKKGETPKKAEDAPETEAEKPVEYVEISNATVDNDTRKQFASLVGDAGPREIGGKILRTFLETLPSKKNNLILIHADDSDVAPTLPRFKENMEIAFKDVPPISIFVHGNRIPQPKPETDKSSIGEPTPEVPPEIIREFFLVRYEKSDALKAKFVKLSEALTKGNDNSEIIIGNFKAIGKKLLVAANNEALDIIVLDISEFDDIQKKVVECIGQAGGYEVQEIEITPEGGDMPAPKPPKEPEFTNAKVVDMDIAPNPLTISYLAKKMNMVEKKGAFNFHWVFVDDVKTKAIKQGLLQKGKEDEVVDDTKSH